MIFFIIFTIISVSIDSFVCGFSLSYIKGKKFYVVLIITLIVFIMCLIANYAAALAENIINEKTANLGGVILIAIGVINIVKKDDYKPIGNGKIVKQSVLTGIAVGFDGAFADLSLAIMGYNDFWVPLSIAIAHAIMVWLGIVLAKTKLAQKFGEVSYLPPVILVALGLYKLLGFFI